MPTITVELKVIGQKRPVFTDYRLPLPPEVNVSEGITLRDLITHIVLQEVETFRQRKAERRLAQVLSPQLIEHSAAQGKIESGERELEQDVNDDESVGVALQAFEDGIYFVFVDDVQRESLNQTVFVGENSRIMFVRLVALAGG